MPVPFPRLWKREAMCRRTARLGVTVLGVLGLIVAACGGGPSSAERAACTAAERLVDAKDRDELRRHLSRMVEQADRSGNAILERAARDFEKAVDDFDPPATERAIGRFYEACEDAGVELKPVDAG